MVGYIGLGSNLGHRRAWLERGVRGLHAAGLRPVAASSVWETRPVGTAEPMWFLNMVVAVRTNRAPLEVLDVLVGIERRAGRIRGRPNAPRTLDMDLLLLGDVRWDDDRLSVPHPRMWRRSFVLEPLCQIAPFLVNPASGRTVREECERLRGSDVVIEAGRLRLADIIRPSTPRTRSASRHEVQIDRR